MARGAGFELAWKSRGFLDYYVVPRGIEPIHSGDAPCKLAPPFFMVCAHGVPETVYITYGFTMD